MSLSYYFLFITTSVKYKEYKLMYKIIFEKHLIIIHIHILFIVILSSVKSIIELVQVFLIKEWTIGNIISITI